MAVTMEDIKKLREETGAGVMDAKRALEDSKGDMKKAKEWIAKKGVSRAESKSDRETASGVVFTYVHHDNQSGAIIELNCETDFVARTDDFTGLAKELAMQITSNDPENVEDFLTEAYNRDSKKTIDELIKVTSGKLGEKITLKRFLRYRLGG
jgi:elongation factor Ts